jgi:hypothetical protein
MDFRKAERENAYFEGVDVGVQQTYHFGPKATSFSLCAENRSCA